MPQMMEQMKRAEHDVAGIALGSLIGAQLFTLVMLCLDYMGH